MRKPSTLERAGAGIAAGTMLLTGCVDGPGTERGEAEGAIITVKFMCELGQAALVPGIHTSNSNYDVTGLACIEDDGVISSDPIIGDYDVTPIQLGEIAKAVKGLEEGRNEGLSNRDPSSATYYLGFTPDLDRVDRLFANGSEVDLKLVKLPTKDGGSVAGIMPQFDGRSMRTDDFEVYGEGITYDPETGTQP